MTADVVVAGQLARDLVLVAEDVPEAGQSHPVRERREMLGGKGANQAVAVAQLGLRPALIAVAGDDEADSRLLEQAGRDGIDVSAVAIREGTATGLIVDIVDAAGH
jgi:ribokinase